MVSYRPYFFFEHLVFVDNALTAMRTANNSIEGIDFSFNGATSPLAKKMCYFPPCTE